MNRPNPLVAACFLMGGAIGFLVVTAGSDHEVDGWLWIALALVAGIGIAIAAQLHRLDRVNAPVDVAKHHSTTASTGLTAAELRAMDITVDLVHVVCQQVIGDGPTRTADVNEFVAHIHRIQQTILSQAAGRAHPDRFRLLGSTIPKEPS